MYAGVPFEGERGCQITPSDVVVGQGGTCGRLFTGPSVDAD